MSSVILNNYRKALYGKNLIAPNAVLTVVTKYTDSQSIAVLAKIGHIDFAESRVAAAIEKYRPLKLLYPQIKLRMIGHLQSNKVKEALSIFNVIETIDSLKLAEIIAKHKESKDIEFFVQVNLEEEAKKTGLLPKDIPQFMQYCPLRISGVMSIIPDTKDVLMQTSCFKKVVDIARQYNLPKISIGMSQDYEIALKSGSTEIRIGSLIFGGS